MAKRSKTGLREIADPFVVAAPSGAATKTRARVTSIEDEFLYLIGKTLGGERNKDLALLLATGGKRVGKADWNARKTSLTARTSARWAGAITQASHHQYAVGMRCLRAERDSLRIRIKTISERLAVPHLSANPTRKPYREGEWYAKARRLAVLQDRFDRVVDRISRGHPRIVFGGGRLWRNRENLGAAGRGEQEWRREWDAQRLFLEAPGETGRRFGNDTIRVGPDGTVTIFVPAILQNQIPPELLNPKDPKHITLSHKVSFHHRGGEWADRVHANKAVKYAFAYTPSASTTGGRWFLTASWSYPPTVSVPLSALRAQRTLALDLNKDHLAGWVVDSRGNRVGEPVTFVLNLEDFAATTRDAWLRHAVTTILKYAREKECASVTIEDLNFTKDSEGRDSPSSTRWLRRIVAGMPTAQFRDRLTAMAATQGIPIVAVDPAYTSKWAKQHWLKSLQPTPSSSRPLSNATAPPRVERHHQVSVTIHHAAALVIGRRMFGLSARRRMNGPRQRQRTLAGQPAVARDSVATIVQAKPLAEQSLTPIRESTLRQQVKTVGSHPVGSRQPFTGHSHSGSNIPTLPNT